MKILVLRTGAVGDTILLSPVLQNLRVAIPGSEVHVLGHPERVGLLLGPPNADRVFSSEDPGWLDLHRDSKPQPETERWIAGYRLVIGYSARPGGFVERNFGRILGDRFVWGAVHPPESYDRHASEFLLEPLQKLGVATDLRTPIISAPGKKPGGAAPDRPMIVIHPGAGGTKKRRPLELFLGAADEIERETSLECRFILGPAEMDLAEGIEAAGRIARSGMTLDEVIGLLRNARGYLGHDSGISHLAAAIGVPTVAIFTTTDPVVWRPLGPQVLVVDVRAGLTDRCAKKKACGYLMDHVTNNRAPTPLP